jgi:hypothetical protein
MRTAYSRQLKPIGVLLLLVTLALYSITATAQQFVKNGNTTTYRNNKFVLSESKLDTLVTTNEKTGEEIWKIRKSIPRPIDMNGNKIYSLSELGMEDQLSAGKELLEQYFLKGMSSYFKGLDNGTYRIDLHNLVQDEKGKIVFYQLGPLMSRDSTGKKIRMTHMFYKAFDAKIDQLVNAAPAQPVVRSGDKAVPAVLDVFLYKRLITVTDHKLTISNN